MHEDRKGLKRVKKASFTEKDVTLPNGTVLHYVEGPANDRPPLFLIHGQTGGWKDYWPVLPQLAEKFRVFAVDCHGHGGSSTDPARYKASLMGEDLTWFIENVIEQPVVISGHSSGGLLAAWVAANASQDVVGAVLEDPPFFSTEKGERWEKSFAYVDTYEPIHRFLNQDEEKDWPLFYIENAKWGEFVGEKGIDGMLKYGRRYREKHPDKPLRFFFLPETVNHMFWLMNDYDLRFGETFYDGSWFDGFDQAETLAKIQCPTVLMHTNWSIDKDGILMGAMSGEDAKRAHDLVKESRLIEVDSGHDVHYEKPEEFIAALDMLVESMGNSEMGDR